MEFAKGRRRKPNSARYYGRFTLMCGIAGIMTVHGSRPEAAAGRAHDRRARPSRARRDGVQRRRSRHGAERGSPSSICRPAISRSTAAAARRWSPMAKSTTTSSCGSACRAAPLRDPLRLRAAAASLRRDGLDFADELRGMYAIAIHDPARPALVLARDPVRHQAALLRRECRACFAFASEPQRAASPPGIVEPAVAPRPARTNCSQLQFTTGRETIFAGIHRVLPGETLIVVERGRIVERRQPLRAAAHGRRPPFQPTRQRRWRGWTWRFVDSVGPSALRRAVRHVPVRRHQLVGHAGHDGAAQRRRRRGLHVGFPDTGVADERPVRAAWWPRASGSDHVELDFDAQISGRLLPRVAARARRSRRRLRRAADLKLARAAAGTCKVICQRRGRRRAVRRLWPLPARDAAALARRRQMRRHGTLDGLGMLAASSPEAGATASPPPSAPRRAASAAGCRRRRRPICADWLPNDRADQARPLPDGAWRRGAHAVPRPGGRRRSLSACPTSSRCTEAAGKWLLRRWLAARRCRRSHAIARKRGFTVPGRRMDRAARPDRIGPLVARAGRRARNLGPRRRRKSVRAPRRTGWGRAMVAAVLRLLASAAHCRRRRGSRCLRASDGRMSLAAPLLLELGIAICCASLIYLVSPLASLPNAVRAAQHR